MMLTKCHAKSSQSRHYPKHFYFEIHETSVTSNTRLYMIVHRTYSCKSLDATAVVYGRLFMPVMPSMSLAVKEYWGLSLDSPWHTIAWSPGWPMWESDWLQILGSGRFFKQRQMGGSDVVKYLSVRPRSFSFVLRLECWRWIMPWEFCFPTTTSLIVDFNHTSSRDSWINQNEYDNMS